MLLPKALQWWKSYLCNVTGNLLGTCYTATTSKWNYRRNTCQPTAKKDHYQSSVLWCKEVKPNKLDILASLQRDLLTNDAVVHLKEVSRATHRCFGKVRSKRTTFVIFVLSHIQSSVPSCPHDAIVPQLQRLASGGKRQSKTLNWVNGIRPDDAS